MTQSVTRRRLLATVVGAAGALAGCSTTSEPPPECTDRVGFTIDMMKFHVEPYETKYRESEHEDSKDADPDKVPEIQRRIGPGPRVTVVDEFNDYNDYVFYGLVSEPAAKEACRFSGVNINKHAWKPVYNDEGLPHVQRRLSILRDAGVELPDVEAKVVNQLPHVLYPEDIPHEEMFRINRMLRPMGNLVVSVGNETKGRFQTVNVDAVTLRETTVVVELVGDKLSALLSTYEVGKHPERHPLKVFLDGTHVGTRRLTAGDLDGSQLVDPKLTLTFPDPDSAATAGAVLADQARSFIRLYTTCDNGPTPTQVPWY